MMTFHYRGPHASCGIDRVRRPVSPGASSHPIRHTHSFLPSHPPPLRNWSIPRLSLPQLRTSPKRSPPFLLLSPSLPPHEQSQGPSRNHLPHGGPVTFVE